ncbi:MAG TPA: DUF2249 domain-containing protein [Streptosporangiaceae bacterium]
MAVEQASRGWSPKRIGAETGVENQGEPTMAHHSRGHRPPQDASAATGGPSTLAGEHIYLLEEVTARAEDLLMVTAQNRWPERELRALIDYLQTEVIRQIRDEERLVLPYYDAVSNLVRLTRDHTRLRVCIDAIAAAATGHEPRSPAKIATTTRDLLLQMEHHFSVEDTTLARPGTPAPATATLGAHPHRWYPLTEGPVIDLDRLPRDEVIEAIRDRLLRLGHGQQLELRSSSDPDPMFRRLAETERDDYGFAYLHDEPAPWRVTVTRRAAS